MEIYDFKLRSLDGSEIDMQDFRGKKLMLVNVASECGFTSQYEHLEALHQAHKDKLSIIGLPCNDFGNQEPGTAQEIAAFCTTKFSVSFTMTEKVGIIKQKHPIYAHLAELADKLSLPIEPDWNFCKYLIDEQGTLVTFHPSSVIPLDERILNWISS